MTERFRYCPLEPGEPVSEEECSCCANRPEPPQTICALPKGRRGPRPRGFWDKEV